MAKTDNVARRAWRGFEPVHAIVYFAPEAPQRLASIGLRGYWMSYFASRAAPMGEVGPEAVTAVFHVFAPTMVHRALPDAWRFAKREAIIAARLEGVDHALRRLWGERVDSTEVEEAATLATEAARGLESSGRPLLASHAGLQQPRAPHLALWHACTLLREHRFEGHLAALTGYGVSGLDALVLHAAEGFGLDDAAIRKVRGWSEEQWDAAVQRLRERELLDAEGGLSDKGHALRGAVERVTDSLAAEPWDRLGSDRSERLFSLLYELALKLEGPGGLVYPIPSGVDRPERG